MMTGTITIPDAWVPIMGPPESVSVEYNFDPETEDFFLSDPTGAFFHSSLLMLAKTQEAKIRRLIDRDIEAWAAQVKEDAAIERHERRLVFEGRAP